MQNTAGTFVRAACSLVLFASCGGSTPEARDASASDGGVSGTSDTGTSDTGASDTGTSGASDSGVDASRVDAAAGDVDASGADAGGAPSRVTEVGTCTPPSSLPGGTCRAVEVSCEGLPPLRAELAIARPPAGTARRGTIVFGTGGTGDEFYASGAMPTRAAMTELLRAGYSIVDRRWPEGWFGASARGAGLAAPSCRYAALIAWIEDEIHAESGGSLCATGNSGGSSEIAYGLTRRGLADRLRAVVLTGGPPMGRIDLGCLDEVADPSWRDTCARYWSDAEQSCPSAEPRCAYADRDMAAAPLVMNVAYDDGTRADRCTGGDASARELFAEDSVVAPGVELSYPDTHVHFIHGRQDCTEAVTLGRFYYEAITSTRTIEYPDATLHTIDRSESGMLAVRQALEAHCVP